MRTVRAGGAALLLLIPTLLIAGLLHSVAAALVAWRRSCLAAPRPAVLSASLHAAFDDAFHDGGGAAERPGPALVFESPEVDLGRLAPGEARRVEVPWRRAGAGALRVREVATGCGCVVARGLEGVLAEGAAGVLVLDVAGRARAGPFAQTVRVLTDRPPDDVLTVRVRGFVGGSALVSPQALLLGPVHPEERLVRWLTVRYPPGTSAARGPVPGVDAKFVGVVGTLRGLPPARAGAGGWDLEVTLTAPTRGGPFSGSVEMRLGDEGLVRVPIGGGVEGTP